jgi:hypothetical protein
LGSVSELLVMVAWPCHFGCAMRLNIMVERTHWSKVGRERERGRGRDTEREGGRETVYECVSPG